MSTHRLAVVPGDGIGPEVTAEACKVLDAVAAVEGFATDRTEFDLGGRRFLETGEVLGDSTLEELRTFDAILLGAVGTPDVPPGVLETGLLLRLRFALDQYVNLRPVKLLPGVESPVAGLTPDRCDMVIVRENTESVYAGAGGAVHVGTTGEVATQTSLNTHHGVQRVLRYAFETARRRDRRLTLVHKTNVLTHAGGLWMRVFEELGEAEFADVERDYVHVDAMCLYLVTQPERFDTVVTENLFGDIITDLGAAVQGGLGLAASGNIDPERRGPSMFEPVHGSAPDIAGQGVADPVAAVLSVGIMLQHLGEEAAAGRVERAVGAWLVERAGAAVPTAEAGDRIAALVGE